MMLWCSTQKRSIFLKNQSQAMNSKYLLKAFPINCSQELLRLLK